MHLHPNRSQIGASGCVRAADTSCMKTASQAGKHGPCKALPGILHSPAVYFYMHYITITWTLYMPIVVICYITGLFVLSTIPEQQCPIPESYCPHITESQAGSHNSENCYYVKLNLWNGNKGLALDTKMQQKRLTSNITRSYKKKKKNRMERLVQKQCNFFLNILYRVFLLLDTKREPCNWKCCLHQ